jgi:hypothetical protein
MEYRQVGTGMWNLPVMLGIYHCPKKNRYPMGLTVRKNLPLFPLAVADHLLPIGPMFFYPNF